MNKPQRVTIGIVLILMGIVTLIFMTTTVEHVAFYTSGGVRYRVDVLPNSMAWFACLLGIVFTGAGIFVLIGKKGG